VRWRGAVRYGGAVVTVQGMIEDPDGPTADHSPLIMRAVGTGQRFRIQRARDDTAQSPLPRGVPVRVTGRVLKEREGKDNEIWLELERDRAAK
jgi:hypothetical protein